MQELVVRSIQDMATFIFFQPYNKSYGRGGEAHHGRYATSISMMTRRKLTIHYIPIGQHLLWTEQSGPSNLDPTVWPRAAASAELFWSNPAAGNISTAVDTALPRLHENSYRMRQRGIKTIDLQPQWCALRPGACDLTA